MLLKHQDQTLTHKLWEFDFWVTPSIVDIRDTARFRLEMRRVVKVLDALVSGVGESLDEVRFSASLVDSSIAYLDSLAATHAEEDYVAVAEEFLLSLSALLFLVTGKSDNNNKCQFPIYLRNQSPTGTMPILKTKKKSPYAVHEPVTRVVDSDSYMARVARVYVAARQLNCDNSLVDLAPSMLLRFVEFLLADDASRKQLVAYLNHYRSAKISGNDATILLTPLVMFQVRGSVAASGGHEPEEMLRSRMTEWGMKRDIDFNITDVILDVEAGQISESNGQDQESPKGKTKTRAYDFALPFRTPTWHPRIFIQSQFYAGDSGSVSHKNVDQTKSSRQSATALSEKAWPESPPPLFLEYVDGAGYSASLNGDLQSLLSYADTAGFFQIRSAPIRLRRELQRIGFLTPMEIGHAILRRSGVVDAVLDHLKDEHYSVAEIERATHFAVQNGFIEPRDGGYSIPEDFLSVVRRHLLLDVIACEGDALPTLVGAAGYALVPGYGPWHGMKLSALDVHVRSVYQAVWPQGFAEDLQNLCEAGFVVLR